MCDLILVCYNNGIDIRDMFNKYLEYFEDLVFDGKWVVFDVLW